MRLSVSGTAAPLAVGIPRGRTLRAPPAAASRARAHARQRQEEETEARPSLFKGSLCFFFSFFFSLNTAPFWNPVQQCSCAPLFAASRAQHRAARRHAARRTAEEQQAGRAVRRAPPALLAKERAEPGRARQTLLFFFLPAQRWTKSGLGPLPPRWRRAFRTLDAAPSRFVPLPRFGSRWRAEAAGEGTYSGLRAKCTIKL